ncbi:MAG: ral secretory system protein domain protein [Myxococcales bacterium]|nr:ral secretory system protein domain protein [Myxococcales bacterium]
MTSRLASLLVQDGLVSAKKMAEAFQRQVIYGGTLDTILLEMDVMDEGTLLDALGRSSAMPTAGDLPSVEQLQAADVQKWMPPAMSERYRAVPVALDGNVLRVIVIDPPDRKQLDELGYTLSLAIEAIIVPEHRFVQAAELVYGVPVPARFASLAAKLRQRATDPNRARLVPQQPAIPMQPLREHARAAVPSTVAPKAAPTAAPTPTAAPAPTAAPTPTAVHAPAKPETRRTVVTDVPMPNANPATAPIHEVASEPTPRLTQRQASAPMTTVAPEAAVRIPSAPAGADAGPLALDDARRAIDEADDRDGIFESLCRGARARLPFAAILTVHADVAAGRLALGSGWLDKQQLAGVSVALDKPSPFRAAAVGRAPYLGRLGDDPNGTQILAAFGRKTPLPALLMPVVLRERAVALLYADNDGQDLDADIVADMSTLVAAAARSFQRLILRAKGGEYAKAPPTGGAKLGASDNGNGTEGGDWRRPTGEGGVDAKARTTNPRFSVALVNAVKDTMTGGGSAARTSRDAAAPEVELHEATTQPNADVDGLLSSVERQDEHAAMSASALVTMGDRAAAALVARLPGPLRLDRHTLRGATPPLEEHGPFLAILTRMGRSARDPLVQRLGDSSLEVRYYATLALGELQTPDVVAPLGMRLYDPDAGVRRAAVDALALFPDSPELRSLIEQLRGELPGPDALRQRYASEALGTLRDVTAVPRLMELVKHQDPSVVSAARKALVEITKQDFGTSRWRWRSWWERHRDQPRVEWMLEGLGHSEAEVRLSACEELRSLSDDEFGYSFDAPKREREDARKKWVDWVRNHGPRQQDKR